MSGLKQSQPEIIVGDNGSIDGTWETLQSTGLSLPVPLRTFQISTPGKSRILNEAVRIAKGDLLFFLDDDVIVDRGWLDAVATYFNQSPRLAAQGTIRIPPEELTDPEVARLVQRYRTVHQFEYDRNADDVQTLNGANMAIRREVFAKVGNFDTRLGPGALGTSEDVELAQRIRLAGIKIGYMADAVVYHELNRERLTEAYFKTLHQKQGRSRLIYKDQSAGRIIFDYFRVTAQFAFYALSSNERKTYRSKGRMYHYRAMLQTKLGIKNSPELPTRDRACPDTLDPKLTKQE